MNREYIVICWTTSLTTERSWDCDCYLLATGREEKWVVRLLLQLHGIWSLIYPPPIGQNLSLPKQPRMNAPSCRVVWLNPSLNKSCTYLKVYVWIRLRRKKFAQFGKTDIWSMHMISRPCNVEVQASSTLFAYMGLSYDSPASTAPIRHDEEWSGLIPNVVGQSRDRSDTSWDATEHRHHNLTRLCILVDKRFKHRYLSSLPNSMIEVAYRSGVSSFSLHCWKIARQLPTSRMLEAK